MLEFYHKFYPNKFEKKVTELIQEMSRILQLEGVSIQNTNTLNIQEVHQSQLSQEVFQKINDIYYTVRNGKLANHFLLKKYLPETRKEPLLNKPFFGDFFAGAGGLSQGLSQAGFEPAFVNDHDVDSIETYYFNHTLPLERFFVGDIREFIKEIGSYQNYLTDIKVVAGGPPCQGFSMANRQRLLDDPRNELYKDFLIILRKIKPDFSIMENVPGMRHKIKEIEKDIESYTGTDYKYTELRINAKDIGIPQNRDRFFLIGNRVGLNNSEIGVNIANNSFGNHKYKLSDAIDGLPILKVNPYKNQSHYEDDECGYMIRKWENMKSPFISEINQNHNSDYLFNHKSRYNQLRDIEIFEKLPQGANSLHESIKDLMPYTSRNDVFKDKYYRLENDKISKAITAHMQMDCNSYIHPTQARGLSPREAARIQTFPDDYVFRGFPNDWYQQIGNAVPVKLAEAIAKELIKYYE